MKQEWFVFELTRVREPIHPLSIRSRTHSLFDDTLQHRTDLTIIALCNSTGTQEFEMGSRGYAFVFDEQASLT